MDFREYLTPEERQECWRVGFVRKMASAGVKPSDVGMTKEAFYIPVASELAEGAGTVLRAGGATLKGTMALALLTGLPIGAALHFLGRAMTKDNKETEKLTALRDTYNTVIEGIKNRSKTKDTWSVD